MNCISINKSNLNTHIICTLLLDFLFRALSAPIVFPLKVMQLHPFFEFISLRCRNEWKFSLLNINDIILQIRRTYLVKDVHYTHTIFNWEHNINIWKVSGELGKILSPHFFFLLTIFNTHILSSIEGIFIFKKWAASWGKYYRLIISSC